MRSDNRLNFILTKLEETFLVFGLAAMGVIMAVQVISRQVFGMSIVWSEELAIHIFIWMIFIGVSYGMAKNTHVNLDYFVEKFPSSVRKTIKHTLNVIIYISLVYLLWYSFKYVDDQMKINSPAMGYPMGLVALAMPVSIVLTLIRTVQSSFNIIKSKEGI